MRALVSAAALSFALGGCATIASDPAPRGRVAAFDHVDYRGSDPVDDGRTVAAGDYRNPVLQGFYPDPSITRVGDDYYLVTSTFSYFPGIPVFRSRDLVTWEQIGNAIDRPDQLDFGTLGLSRGVFAPTIEHHRGTYYIFNTCVDCGDNFVVTASDPAGPWSDPIWLPDLRGGIDPSLFVDADGSAWLLNNGPPVGTPRYDGHRAIWIQAYDLATNRTTGPRTVLIDGGVDPSTNPIWIEGPHIIPRDGRYYLIAAEGGTAEGHSQVVLRADSPDGPYTPYSGNPILTQRGLPRDRPNPITSAGHADFVRTSSGEWWATFLAVRPYGDDLYNTGRETFLLPVTWGPDGWPRMTAPDEVVAAVHPRPALPRQPAPALPTNGPFTVREPFDGPLGPHWMMLRNPRATWHRIEGGRLLLDARAPRLGDRANPSYLGRRQQHRRATVETRVTFAPRASGDRAGLAALQSDEHWYLLSIAREAGARVVLVERRAGEAEPAVGTIVARAPIGGGDDDPVDLRIITDDGRIAFAYADTPGAWRTLLEGADATILSTKVAGGFVGVTFGPYAHAGE